MQIAEYEIPAPGRIEIDPRHRSDKSELPALRRVIPDNDQVSPLAGAASIRGRYAIGHEVNAIRLDGFRLLGQQHGLSEEGFADRQSADRKHFAGIVCLVITRINGFRRAGSTGRQFGPGGLFMVRQHIERIFGPRLQSLKTQGGLHGRDSLSDDLLQRENALRGLAEDVFIGGRIRQRHGVADLGSRDLAFLVDGSPGIVGAGSPFERNFHLGDRRIVVERAIRQYGHVRARVGDRGPCTAVLHRCGYGYFRGGETHGPSFGPGDYRRADALFHNRINLCLAGLEQLFPGSIGDREEKIIDDRNVQDGFVVVPKLHYERFAGFVVICRGEKRVAHAGLRRRLHRVSSTFTGPPPQSIVQYPSASTP